MQLWSDKRSGLIKSNITSAKLLCSSHPSSCYSFFFRYYNMKMFGFNELYSFVSNPFLSRVRQIHVKICESLPTSFERTGCFFGSGYSAGNLTWAQLAYFCSGLDHPEALTPEISFCLDGGIVAKAFSVNFPQWDCYPSVTYEGYCKVKTNRKSWYNIYKDKP